METDMLAEVTEFQNIAQSGEPMYQLSIGWLWFEINVVLNMDFLFLVMVQAVV